MTFRWNTLAFLVFAIVAALTVIRDPRFIEKYAANPRWLRIAMGYFAAGLALFLLSMTLAEMTAPEQPLPDLGMTVPWELHRHTFYITRWWSALIHLSGVAVFLMFFPIWLAGLYLWIKSKVPKS